LIIGLRLIKWIGIIAAVIAIASAVAIAVMPWGWLKAYAMDQANAAIGRKLTIENIDLVDLSLTPRIRLEKVRLANTTWSDRPYMLVIPQLAFSIDLLALLEGGIVLSDVDIKQPKLHLAMSRKGKPNWVFLTAQPANGKPAIPIIEHWRIKNARATYRNLRSGISLKGTIGSAEGMIEGTERHVWLQGNGHLEGKPWRMTSDVGALLERGHAQQSNKIQVQLKLGNTQAEIGGSVMRPLNFNEFELDFMVKGRDPARLNQLAPVALPHVPRYRFEAGSSAPPILGRSRISPVLWELAIYLAICCLRREANGYGYMPTLPPTRLTLCKYLGLLSNDVQSREEDSRIWLACLPKSRRRPKRKLRRSAAISLDY
jgi:AsmA family protein